MNGKGGGEPTAMFPDPHLHPPRFRLRSLQSWVSHPSRSGCASLCLTAGLDVERNPVVHLFFTTAAPALHPFSLFHHVFSQPPSFLVGPTACLKGTRNFNGLLLAF